MIRAVLGVCAGLIVWNFAFLAQGYLLAALWPDFATYGRLYQSAKIFDFTWQMACLLLLFWVVAEVGAGWITTKIARQPAALWVLTGVGLTYAVAVHIVLHWARFPWWYNLGVVIPIVPAVLLGGEIRRRGFLANR